MNQFSIRDIENLCGIKAHTLRIWEQRYKLFVPKRKESQHRVYDCDDLKELLRISFLYHHGYKISKIVCLTPQQIQEEVARIKPQCCNYEVFVHQLIEASISFDKVSFEKIVNNLVAKIGLEKSIFLVIYPFLHRIGLLWMTNHIIPAQEHFSSHIIRKKILCGIDGVAAQGNVSDKKVLIFAPSGELHEIPLLAVNYIFKKLGIRTAYFGTDVTPETLEYYLTYHRVTHIYMHVITHFDNCSLEAVVWKLCHKYPDLTIVVSGPACKCLCMDMPNLVHLHSPDELLRLGNSLAGKIQDNFNDSISHLGIT